MIESVVIIEMNGWRVRSEVDWPERTRQIVITSTLIDEQGAPLPQVEGEHPVEMRHLIVMSPNPDYSEDQLIYDVESARFGHARELAGHPHVIKMRERIGPHKHAPAGPPQVISAPRFGRPGKEEAAPKR